MSAVRCLPRCRRRILRRNEHVHAVEAQPLATGEQYALFSRYVLTRHRDVASVVFTGSVATGEKVARDAGLKNRVLELGGNGPQIVLADGNLEAAADAAVMGCFYLAGQVCTAAERVLVHTDVHDQRNNEDALRREFFGF